MSRQSRGPALTAWLKLLLLAILLAPTALAQEFTRYSIPETCEELVTLSRDAEFEPALAEKLERITTTPFITIEAYYRGAEPFVPDVRGLARRACRRNPERVGFIGGSRRS